MPNEQGKEKWADYPDPYAAWAKDRRAPGETRDITIEQQDFKKTLKTSGKEVHVRKNHGLKKGKNKVTSGLCPCKNECGHTFMWECEDADCKCCTSACN